MHSFWRIAPLRKECTVQGLTMDQLMLSFDFCTPLLHHQRLIVNGERKSPSSYLIVVSTVLRDTTRLFGVLLQCKVIHLIQQCKVIHLIQQQRDHSFMTVPPTTRKPVVWRRDDDSEKQSSLLATTILPLCSLRVAKEPTDRPVESMIVDGDSPLL